MRLDNVTELRTTKAHLNSLDNRAHPLPWMLHRAIEWRARYRFARQCDREWMSARERQTGCRLKQFGIQRSDIDHARFWQCQRSGLVEDNSIDARQPLDGVPGVQNDAGPKKCA